MNISGEVSAHLKTYMAQLTQNREGGEHREGLMCKGLESLVKKMSLYSEEKYIKRDNCRMQKEQYLNYKPETMKPKYVSIENSLFC